MSQGVRIDADTARKILRAMKGKKANVHNVAIACKVSHTTVLRVVRNPDLYLKAGLRQASAKPREKPKAVRCPECGHLVIPVEGQCFECYLIRTRRKKPLTDRELPPLPRAGKTRVAPPVPFACSPQIRQYFLSDLAGTDS